jgi:hypothetical protein
MSRSVPSIAFIICSEKGLLEKKSVLLAKSIRKHSGSLKDAPIYSISPRKNHTISASTEKSFEELNICHQNIELNSDFKDYGLANKILACSYFEKQLDEDVLIFCDSDLMVLGSIDELLLDIETDISIQKVAIKGIGSNGSDANASYWQDLYRITNVNRPTLMSIPGGERIFPYFNSGLIAVKKSIGLFSQWEKNFRKMLKKGILPQQGLFFVEQSVLSATISSMQLKIKTLPKSYNYHFLKNTDSIDTFQKIADGKIKLLHYHKSMDEGKRIVLPDGTTLQNSSIIEWINNELINCGINANPFVSEWEVELLKNKHKVFNLFNNSKNN